MNLRVVPAAGLYAWAKPDPSAAPSTTLASGQQVDLLEQAANGWAHVRLPSGDEVWVDGTQLMLPSTATPGSGQSTRGSSSRWILAAVALVVVAAVAGGVIGAFVLNRDDDTPSDTVVADQPPDQPADEAAPAEPAVPVFEPQPGADEADVPAADQSAPGSVETPSQEPPPGDAGDLLSFPDELIETAMAEAAASPATGLPTMDAITTARLTRELLDAGLDLTGLGVSVYPDSAADSFLLLETTDSTALLNAEEGAETFVTDLLDSPALAEAETKRLVLRHSGADDEGPYVLTITVLVEDLQRAAATGEDVFASVAADLQRP